MRKIGFVYISIYFWDVTSFHIYGKVPGISRLASKITGMGKECANIHCSEQSC